MPAPVSLAPMRRLIFPDQQQDRSNRYCSPTVREEFPQPLGGLRTPSNGLTRNWSMPAAPVGHSPDSSIN
jgi:hypothetical protein